MLFYYHLLHITKRLYVSHNGGCVSRARRKNGAYRRIKTQKGPPPFGRGPLRAGSPTPKSTTIIPQKDFGNEIRFVTYNVKPPPLH